MQVLQGASHVSIHSATFNNIDGDQIINNYTTVIKDKKDRTIYEEFNYIKLGNIRSIEDIYREDCVQWTQHDWGLEGARLHAERKISTAKIEGKRGKFTVVSYSGERATEIWEEDFRKHSQARDALKMQLFGINQSHIPMLIFFDELVPLGSGRWELIHPLGKAYLNALSRGWGCSEHNLWIDPKHGKLIRGMEGPKCPGNLMNFLPSLTNDETPSTINCLQEDVVFRYLSRLPLDKEFDKRVLSALTWKLPSPVLNLTDMKTNRSLILPALTNRPIAVGRLLWRSAHNRKCLDSRVMMADGKIRFTLVKDSKYLYVQVVSRPSEDEAAWLSQASSVFHKHGIPLGGDLSQYELIVPDIQMSGQVDESEASRQLRQSVSKIYLFVLSSSYAHFWSHDATGRKRIRTKTCEYLGLPIKFDVEVYASRKLSWPSKMYKDIHNWQVHRKFDPTTANFASYLGYFTYKVVRAKESQFEELENDSEEDFALAQLFHHDLDAVILRHAPSGPEVSQRQSVAGKTLNRSIATARKSAMTTRRTTLPQSHPTSSGHIPRPPVSTSLKRPKEPGLGHDRNREEPSKTELEKGKGKQSNANSSTAKIPAKLLNGHMTLKAPSRGAEPSGGTQRGSIWR
ncbi:hypothetical protein E1B28_005289 [Marasmius oreades]|uniref:Uncharacterized protein n=1 Tax=Marasmius oreades TaxID=181124 RepID=A0A9P8AE48_9AGAR|nr:uncharacterized protein E1B28_005289 [Marasmius oreades]KAG7097980.1 hypothetical protein E1B28_005289 [Marasmius oreades]